jgi:hypothetical protein
MRTWDPFSDERPDLAGQDLVAQLDVLKGVLSDYPRRHWTVVELSVAINEDRPFACFDTVERAVRELVAVRLLYSRKARLVPGGRRFRPSEPL